MDQMSPSCVTGGPSPSSGASSAGSASSPASSSPIRMSISGGLETGDGDVDGEFELQEALELDGEQLPVPARVFGKLVVGDDVGADLGGREVREADRRHLLDAEPYRRFDAAVAGDDAAVTIDQHRVGKPKPLDAVRDLADLFFFGVGPGVGDPGLERGGVLVADLEAVHGAWLRCCGAGQTKSAAPDVVPKATLAPWGPWALQPGRGTP